MRLSIAGAGGPVPQLRLLEIKKATEEKDRSLTTLYLVVGSYPIPVRENTDSGFPPVSRPLLTDPFEWRSLPQAIGVLIRTIGQITKTDWLSTLNSREAESISIDPTAQLF